MVLTAQQLRQVMPQLTEEQAAAWLPHLLSAMAEFGIASPLAVAMFLAQLAHESAELSRTVESLSYSAARLRKVWPSRFPSDAVAQRYARQPVATAEHVYGGRMGNGPEGTGDGWRYRGRGPLMNTGKDAYRRLGKALGIPLLEKPELLELPEHGARAAGHYWRANGLTPLAEARDLRGATRAINGGLTGLPEREAYWQRALVALGAA